MWGSQKCTQANRFLYVYIYSSYRYHCSWICWLPRPHPRFRLAIFRRSPLSFFTFSRVCFRPMANRSWATPSQRVLVSECFLLSFWCFLPLFFSPFFFFHSAPQWSLFVEHHPTPFPPFQTKSSPSCRTARSAWSCSACVSKWWRSLYIRISLALLCRCSSSCWCVYFRDRVSVFFYALYIFSLITL